MPALWFIGRQGQKFGPYPVPQLQHMITTGHVLRTDMLLEVGSNSWVTATSLPWLFPAEGMPQAITAGHQPPALTVRGAPSGAAQAPLPGSPDSSNKVLWWVLGGVGVCLLLLCGGGVLLVYSIQRAGENARNTFLYVGSQLEASSGNKQFTPEEFKKIDPGMTEAQVTRILGKPFDSGQGSGVKWSWWRVGDKYYSVITENGRVTSTNGPSTEQEYQLGKALMELAK